jgi:hypothetical protein
VNVATVRPSPDKPADIRGAVLCGLNVLTGVRVVAFQTVTALPSLSSVTNRCAPGAKESQSGLIVCFSSSLRGLPVSPSQMLIDSSETVRG